jgi:hypothetical protein
MARETDSEREDRTVRAGQDRTGQEIVLHVIVSVAPMMISVRCSGGVVSITYITYQRVRAHTWRWALLEFHGGIHCRLAFPRLDSMRQHQTRFLVANSQRPTPKHRRCRACKSSRKQALSKSKYVMINIAVYNSGGTCSSHIPCRRTGPNEPKNKPITIESKQIPVGTARYMNRAVSERCRSQNTNRSVASVQDCRELLESVAGRRQIDDCSIPWSKQPEWPT